MLKNTFPEKAVRLSTWKRLFDRFRNPSRLSGNHAKMDFKRGRECRPIYGGQPTQRKRICIMELLSSRHKLDTPHFSELQKRNNEGRRLGLSFQRLRKQSRHRHR